MSPVSEIERQVSAMSKAFRDWFTEYYHVMCSCEGRQMTDDEIQSCMAAWTACKPDTTPVPGIGGDEEDEGLHWPEPIIQHMGTICPDPSAHEPTTPTPARMGEDDAAQNDLLGMSDKQIWADAVREFGSPAAALAEADRIRNIIKNITDETCPKIPDKIVHQAMSRANGFGYRTCSCGAYTKDGQECDPTASFTPSPMTEDELQKILAEAMYCLSPRQLTEQQLSDVKRAARALLQHTNGEAPNE